MTSRYGTVPRLRVTPSEAMTHGKTEQGVKGEVFATSIGHIDPNLCNLVHNVKGCNPEEIEALSGTTLTDGEAASIEMCGPDVPDCIDYLVVPQGEGRTRYDSEAGGNPEPLFVDEEPGYIAQPLDEAVMEDCSLAGGKVYVTVEGQLRCEDSHDSEDNGDELVSSYGLQPQNLSPNQLPRLPRSPDAGKLHII